MLGQSTERGTTFYIRARRNKLDSLFYFQDNSSLTYTIPIAEEFALLKFIVPGGEPD